MISGQGQRHHSPTAQAADLHLMRPLILAHPGPGVRDPALMDLNGVRAFQSSLEGEEGQVVGEEASKTAAGGEAFRMAGAEVHLTADHHNRTH